MAYIDWWNRTKPTTLGERFGLNEISIARNTLSPTKSYTEDRIDMKPGGIVEPGVEYYANKKLTGGKKLIHPMPEGMKEWLKKEKIKIDWYGKDLNRADRAKLKTRFANRNNPYFKGLEQKKIFEDYIEGLIKKGQTSAWDKSIADLVKESKAEINPATAYDVIEDKKFAVKRSTVTKIFPKLEARAIELLNEGLSAPEVTTTLEDEGIIKVKKGWDKSKGLFTRDTRLFTNFYKELLKEGKIKTISETISGTQIPIAERTKIDKAIFDYIKKNPNIDSSHHVAKAVSAEINRDITKQWVENAIRRSGQEPDKLFQTSNKKIFPDVAALDKVLKNNQKLLLDPDISFKEKSRILTKRYAEATGKPLKIAIGEFSTRLKKLGDLYAEQPQRYEKKLYKTIKIPTDYIGSLFHKNFMALADASGQVSIVDKAKLLKLPQNEIKLLSELSTAAGKLGGFSMAGDHTDIDSLMKNFSNYRKNFTRIEWVRDSLNRFKKTYDDKIRALYKAAKRGQTTVMVDGEPVAIEDRIKFFQDEFKNKTGYRIGGFKIDAKGNTYIEPTALRIPDINNPVNTVLRQTLKGLETYKVPKTAEHSAQKPIKITNAFDKTIMGAKTVEERIKALKKWQGKPELLNSRYIKALGAIPRLKSLVKLLTAGTITFGGMTTLATAGTTREKGLTTEEMKARKEEMTEASMVPEFLAEHPVLSTAGAGTAYTLSKPKGRALAKSLLKGFFETKSKWSALWGIEPPWMMIDEVQAHEGSIKNLEEQLKNIGLFGQKVDPETRKLIVDYYRRKRLEKEYGRGPDLGAGEELLVMEGPSKSQSDFAKGVESWSEKPADFYNMLKYISMDQETAKAAMVPYIESEQARKVPERSRGTLDFMTRYASPFVRPFGNLKVRDYPAYDEDTYPSDEINKVAGPGFGKGPYEYNQGGRIGLKKGKMPKIPMTRRGFLQWLLGAAGAGIAAGTGLIKWGKVAGKGKTVIRAGDTIIQGTEGMPSWYIPLVNRIVKEGDNVTKKLGTIDREIVHTKKISKTDEVTVYQDMNTGNVRIEYGPHQFDKQGNVIRATNDNQVVHLEYRAPEVIEEGKHMGKKTKPEFSATEAKPRVTNWEGDIEWEHMDIDKNVDDLLTDTSKLKQFGTKKKLTHKDKVIAKKKQTYQKKLEKDPSEQLEYIEKKEGATIDDLLDEGKAVGEFDPRGYDTHNTWKGMNLPTKKTKKASGGRVDYDNYLPDIEDID